MARIKAGDRAPNFTALDQTGEKVSLAQLRQNRTVVLYFYPKDETAGCTREAQPAHDGLKKRRHRACISASMMMLPLPPT